MIGGSAGDGTHGKDASRPEDMPTKSECDYVVSTKEQLTEHITEDRAKIYIDENVGLISLGGGDGVQDVTVGSGVQLVGQFCDPAYPARGTVIHQPYYHRHLFCTGYGKEPPTLWGISLQGPMLGPDFRNREDYPSEEQVYFDPRTDERTNNGDLDPSDWYASGVFCHTSKDAGTFRAIGCEFFGWSHSGLEIGSKERETQAEIRRCSFHNNLMETLGYGIQQYNGDMRVDRCFFDRNRHGISGFGYPTLSWEATNCLVGDGIGAGHAFDMHDLGANLDDTDTPNMGGHHLAARNCTFLMTEDIGGYGQEGIAQRGQSIAGRAHYSNRGTAEQPGDEIVNCHFAHSNKPRARGEQGDAYREGGDGDSWKSLNPQDNVFGTGLDEQTLANIGAPRARTDGGEDKGAGDTPDKGTESPDSQPSKGHTLTIEGVGEAARYLIEIKGDAETTNSTEHPDEVRESDKQNHTTISGEIVGYADQYRLSEGATVVSARFMGPARVRKDGEPLDTLASIVSAEAHRELWSLEDDLNKRLESVRTDLNAIEGGLDPETKTKIENIMSQVIQMQEQLDSAHISFKSSK